MHRYRIGKLLEPWINRVPPVRGGVFEQPDDKVSPNEKPTPPNTVDKAANPAKPVVESIHLGQTLDKIIQTEVEDGLRDFPSLDIATQSDIEAKYQKLHQRVKDEGFYQCNYTQYAKEIARYSTIFTLFGLALLNGWYLTSAAFLGLFWVRTLPPS